MAEQTWIEIPVFIHGITPHEVVGSHGHEYDALFANIQSNLIARGKAPFTQPPIQVEWGWRYPNSEAPLEDDQYLAEAERIIATQALAIEQGIWDFSLNPARLLHKELRKIFLFGFADLIYYASEDGEATVRQHVFGNIVTEIKKHLAATDGRISLTLFGHSAGSLIAHDLLYHLFGKRKTSPVRKVRQLRELASAKPPRLRVRRLYTFGSPLTPLTFRANSLIQKVRTNTLLDPEELGLRAADKLAGPRWINFWDKDDVASFPVAFRYRSDHSVVRDEYLDLGDFFPDVHNAYWFADSMAARIADSF